LSFLENENMPSEALSPEQAQAAWNELAAERTTPDETAAAAATEPAPTEATVEPVPIEPAPQASESPAPAPQEQEDPLASLPEAVRQRLSRVDDLERLVQSQANDLRAAIGRVGAIQSELAAAKQVSKQVDQAPTQAQMAAAAKTPEKWEQMKADFPDWAEAIEARLSVLPPQLAAPAINPEEISALVQAEVDRRVDAENRQLIERKHRGWQELVKQPAFLDWRAAQPPEIQALGASPYASDAIDMLDRFLEATKVPVKELEQRRQQTLDQAVTTKPGQTPPPKSEEEMTPQELWNYLAKSRQ
jgi:hypothetical protein